MGSCSLSQSQRQTASHSRHCLLTLNTEAPHPPLGKTVYSPAFRRHFCPYFFPLQMTLERNALQRCATLLLSNRQVPAEQRL